MNYKFPKDFIWGVDLTLDRDGEASILEKEIEMMHRLDICVCRLSLPNMSLKRDLSPLLQSNMLPTLQKLGIERLLSVASEDCLKMPQLFDRLKEMGKEYGCRTGVTVRWRDLVGNLGEVLQAVLKVVPDFIGFEIENGGKLKRNENLRSFVRGIYEKSEIRPPIILSDEGLSVRETNKKDLLCDDERMDAMYAAFVYVLRAVDEGIPIGGYFLKSYFSQVREKYLHGVAYFDELGKFALKKSGLWLKKVIQNNKITV